MRHGLKFLCAHYEGWLPDYKEIKSFEKVEKDDSDIASQKWPYHSL